jgi:hypothetical protein
MPSVVSPAQVQTANGENLYVPIDGNTAVFPGGRIETPSVDGSNINGLGAPFLIDTSVIVNGRPVEDTFQALSINGPMLVNYALNPENPYVPTLDVAGDTKVVGDSKGTNLLIAQDFFNIPIGFHDFEGEYNLGPTYCMDFGDSRWVWGELRNISPANRIVDLNSVPANTFANLPKQNATGLFSLTVQNIIAVGAITDYVGVDPPGDTPQFRGYLTIPKPGIYDFATGNLFALCLNSGYNYCFLAIGPPKTA